MKQFLAASLLILLAACDNQPVAQKEEVDAKAAFVPAAPNTVMAEDSVKVPESPNNFSFKVKVIATEYTAKQGTYTIAMVYGPDSNASMFTMPKGAAHLLPELKKKEGYHFIIGFTYMGQFYEYYDVTFTYGFPHTTKVHLIKAYVLE